MLDRGAPAQRGAGERLLVWAKQVVLASGGAGMVYRETTNPPVATGDGMAAAWRAGALLRDMEFMQFHPTVLYVAGSSRFLISEAVRGEGAYLRDKHLRRFMPDVDPRAELAPRDVVAQAIFQQMDKTKHPKVFIGRIKAHAYETVVVGVDALLELAREAHIERVRATLGDLVPEYGAARPFATKTTSPHGERAVDDEPSAAGRKSGTIVSN